ncbi:unnamed protein product [Sphenostylis stenocarpa]|uniref:Uncharacterized protein n=1 Tax=Sphenostylis stenocarpa TaxID=92480 RepID=A0AA86RNM9_9FABA|nr:unnamed protein product [Sphenostylis stenocarpa]
MTNTSFTTYHQLTLQATTGSCHQCELLTKVSVFICIASCNAMLTLCLYSATTLHLFHYSAIANDYSLAKITRQAS